MQQESHSKLLKLALNNKQIA